MRCAPTGSWHTPDVPDVVLIHGAFHELWGPFRLWARWTPSVLDGLWNAGVPVGDVSLPRLQGRSVVAFWGDLVRPEPRMPGDPADGGTGGGGLPGAEPPDGLLDLVDNPVVGARPDPADRRSGGTDLDALVRQVAKDTNARSMELLARYVVDPDMRDRVHERLERHLDENTKVVIAHSLGTVIAYQVLCTRPDLELDLITLGSPLGDPATVFDLLHPAPVDGRGVWPAAVRRWTNVAAEGDLATAACPRLAEAFGDGVEDHLVFNGRHAHDVEPYLNSSPTGAALADALGLDRRGDRSTRPRE